MCLGDYCARFLRKMILSSLFIITSTYCFCQSDYERKIPADLLKQDFNMLRDSLQKWHGALYRYVPKAKLDHIFDSCYASITEDMTIPRFYGLTSFAIGAIEDGHTNCRLPKQVMNDYLNNTKFFPAMVMFIGDRIFIRCSNQNNELNESELLSIDHYSSNEIAQKLFRHIPSDGAIQSRKSWEMNEAFLPLLDIVYGSKEHFDITYKTKTGKVQSTVLTADSIKNIRCANPDARPDKYLSLDYKNGNVAVLTIKTFFDGFLSQTKEDLNNFLAESFKAIKEKHIQKLIIDVRNNGGGNDGNGILLYAYLTKKPFLYYASQETNTEKFPEEGHPNLGMQMPKENNFNGKVFILINGRSFSATAEFAAVAKSNNRAIFIGEETGGGYYGNTSGDDINITLPNSQITARIPMVKYTSAVKKSKYADRGVIPDYIVMPGITDIIQNNDVQMKYALKLAGAIIKLRD